MVGGEDRLHQAVRVYHSTYVRIYIFHAHNDDQDDDDDKDMAMTQLRPQELRDAEGFLSGV